MLDRRRSLFPRHAAGRICAGTVRRRESVDFCHRHRCHGHRERAGRRLPRQHRGRCPAGTLSAMVHRDGNIYTVNKAIRDMVVFAEQDVLLDPPFSHIDLISCRNLLDLFECRTAKAGAAGLSLRTQCTWVSLPRRVRIHRGIHQLVYPGRCANGIFTSATTRPPLPPARRTVVPVSLPARRSPVPPRGRTAADESSRLRTLLEQYLLAHHTPAGVLVNDRGEMLFVHGSTGRYLEPAPGAANLEHRAHGAARSCAWS